MRALANLKARGDIQQCWRQGPNCARTLYAAAPKGHPNSITLGHYVALEDGGDLLDPNNHGPECMACNYGDGARRRNRHAKGDGRGVIFRNPAY